LLFTGLYPLRCVSHFANGVRDAIAGPDLRHAARPRRTTITRRSDDSRNMTANAAKLTF
jgi:hypothetical protein